MIVGNAAVSKRESAMHNVPGGNGQSAKREHASQGFWKSRAVALVGASRESARVIARGERMAIAMKAVPAQLGRARNSLVVNVAPKPPYVKMPVDGVNLVFAKMKGAVQRKRWNREPVVTVASRSEAVFRRVSGANGGSARTKDNASLH